MVLSPMTMPKIACVPGAIPANERPGHFALAARLFKEIAISRSSLSNGYEILFPAAAMTSVAQFLNCRPANTLVLRMTGPSGTRDVLDAELQLGQCNSLGCGCHVA